MQKNPAVKQNKNIKWSVSPQNRSGPVGKEKIYRGNDLPKSQVLSSEWKTERVKKDASGDSEDGEEDDGELPCVIGEIHATMKNNSDLLKIICRRKVAIQQQLTEIRSTSIT